MSISQRLRSSETAIAIVAVLVTSLLSGCQHSSAQTSNEIAETWRVLERVGDVRVTSEGSQGEHLLRSGETVADNRLVTTGRGSLLILAGQGLQLTVGEDTSVHLTGRDGDADLNLHQGWLRARVATLASRTARIESRVFDITTSRATLTLLSLGSRSEISIENGSAVITTEDGRHQATLAAGAAARIDELTPDDLMIRRATEHAFTKVEPLSADLVHDQHQRHIPKQPPRIATQTNDEPLRQPSTEKTERKEVPILLASRLKASKRTSHGGRDPSESSARLPIPAFTKPASTETPARFKEVGYARSDTSASTPAVVPPGDTSITRQTDSVDPFQLAFDRLTDGLLDGL